MTATRSTAENATGTTGLREQVQTALKAAAPGQEADAVIAAVAAFAADQVEAVSDHVDGIATDEREYGRVLAFEECALLLRGLAA